MRITNKIMQNNNLSNINTNKVLEDRLSNQMSTQKKINRPSDDPVVAIRALRLRTSVTEVTQYYSKNIPDASSWLDVTEGALNNLSTIITNMISQCTRGANGDITTSDREIILEQLKALSGEVYTTGDVDYAGRYVFAGYRTDTSMCFPEETDKQYSITEQIHNSELDAVTAVNMGNVTDITEVNYMEAGIKDIKEQAVSKVDVHRFRLAYSDCSDRDDINVCVKSSDNPVSVDWSMTATGDSAIVMKHSYEDPYTLVAEDPDLCIYVPETGELLLGDNRYQKLMEIKDDVTTVKDESEILVSYEKDKFVKGDLRPEHYFYCESDGVKYNKGYLNSEKEKQIIEYDVGFNQTIQVNTVCDECFVHGIKRTVDDLSDTVDEVAQLEKLKSTLTTLKTKATGEDEKVLGDQLDAVEKALTLSKDKCQKMFEKSITAFQNYLNNTNIAMTNCGTRSSKLALVESRMQNQKTTYETLKSENEDVDITETVINLQAASTTYQAALMATGKISQTTLLNYL
ncbi:MAG: hypothetical protein K6F84_03105 [Lachnospiraceae bacterium]|nr:hypothetical protein [Lachnospiraceae bacterium]